MQINFSEEMEKNGLSICRYNGGWTKKVSGLNKSKSNGYSLEGNFLELNTDGLDIIQDGLYLDCDVRGSRKHHEKNYVLFVVKNDAVEILQNIVGGGKDWAMLLWNNIEKALEIKNNPLEKFSLAELQAEIERRENN